MLAEQLRRRLLDDEIEIEAEIEIEIEAEIEAEIKAEIEAPSSPAEAYVEYLNAHALGPKGIPHPPAQPLACMCSSRRSVHFPPGTQPAWLRQTSLSPGDERPMKLETPASDVHVTPSKLGDAFGVTTFRLLPLEAGPLEEGAAEAAVVRIVFVSDTHGYESTLTDGDDAQDDAHEGAQDDAQDDARQEEDMGAVVGDAGPSPYSSSAEGGDVRDQLPPVPTTAPRDQLPWKSPPVPVRAPLPAADILIHGGDDL